MTRFCTLMIGGLVVVFSCSVLARQVVVPNGADVAQQIQKAVIDAKPGDEIILPAGEFKVVAPISLVKKRIQFSGQGIGKTVLDFASVKEGGQAILVRSRGVVVRELTIKNSPGDGVVARGVMDVVLKNLEVKWDSGHPPGGYGLYPVQSKNVLVAGSIVSGAREAGIYLGQSERATLKNNTVFNNVIGIDLENSSYVDVENNTVYNNSVGITAVGRPYLLVINPSSIKVQGNKIRSNNLHNFAEKESLAAAMGSGFGVKVFSTSDVDISKNDIAGHRHSSVYIADFPVLERGYKGEMIFDPFVKNIRVGAEQFGLDTLKVAHTDQVTSNVEGAQSVDVWLDRLSEWDRKNDNKVCFELPGGLAIAHYGLKESRATQSFECN